MNRKYSKFGDGLFKIKCALIYTCVLVMRTTLSEAASVQKDSECGKTIGCFHDCSGDTCSFLLTWLEKGNDIELTLTCARSESDPYCSIGLSDDLDMRDDSVFECLSTSGTTYIYLSYNPGKYNSRLDQSQYGLSSIVTSYSNGILKCSFLRQKTFTSIVTGRKKRSTLSASTYFDMNRDWYLQYAHGTTVSGGFLTKHTSPPLVSKQRADFQSVIDLSATAIKRPLVKAHGILMVFAWTLFSTLGVFAARFYKTAWPDHVEWFGVKPWFMIHRFCMMSVLVLTLISFVIIFVDVEDYVTIVGSTFKKSHPVLGIIVMALVVLNPVMAFFRPKPGTTKRVVFRVAHTLVGVAGQVMAIVNMFSGVKLDSIQISSASTILLATFCGWTFVVEVGLFIYDWYLSQKKKRTLEIELQGSGNASPEKNKEKNNYNMLKMSVLAFHIVALTAFSAAVSALIGSAE